MRLRLAALAVLFFAGHAFADGPVVPAFIEETKGSGIDSVYTGEWQYMVGGGAAAAAACRSVPFLACVDYRRFPPFSRGRHS